LTVRGGLGTLGGGRIQRAADQPGGGRLVRRWIAIGAVLGVLGGGVALVPGSSAGAATSTPSAPKATVQWGKCTDPTLKQAHAQCGFVTAPLDYSHPGNGTVKLAVSRVLHTVPAAQYQGVMLVNPGGPGGSGLVYSILGQFVPKHAGDAYDWIGFDPRGVGASRPALSCDPNYFQGPRPPYRPTTPAILHEWLNRSQAYATACGKAQPALLQHTKTTDWARDMDTIRAALGAKQINYYGFSYGTYLGQVYATLFPTHVRRMVLDSNVDPRDVWYQANLNQDVAFDRNINIWFAWVAKYDSVYHLGTTEDAVRTLFYSEEQRLQASPAGGVVGGDEWDDIFLGAGYYEQTWLDLGSLFSNWIRTHKVAPLVAEYKSTETPGDDNEFAMYNAVQCSDVQWPQQWSTWSNDNWRIDRIAPFETWNNAWFNAPCLYWPATPGTPVTVKGGTIRALLVDETLDAATPFEGSLEVRKLFPQSSLLAEPGGTTHADTLFGDACVDNTIARYLADGTLPARKAGNGPDATCKPLPVPVPMQAQSNAASVSSLRFRLQPEVR
jgi:pimeloyl-ACP methyl ester carboxylesterase